jgi:proteasome lid subunit RPN8/RPN11
MPQTATLLAPVEITADAWWQMVGHCYDGLPLEACGLLAADASGRLVRCYPTGNEAASARVYAVPGKEHLRADRDAEDRGLVIAGVFHSHTRTGARPSPTDVAQAPDPTWRYVLVSLAEAAPVVRCWTIADGEVAEHPMVLVEP